MSPQQLWFWFWNQTDSTWHQLRPKATGGDVSKWVDQRRHCTLAGRSDVRRRDRAPWKQTCLTLGSLLSSKSKTLKKEMAKRPNGSDQNLGWTPDRLEKSNLWTYAQPIRGSPTCLDSIIQRDIRHGTSPRVLTTPGIKCCNDHTVIGNAVRFILKIHKVLFSKNTDLQLLSFYYTRAVVKIQVETPLVNLPP
jgi:hypothetical protein